MLLANSRQLSVNSKVKLSTDVTQSQLYKPHEFFFLPRTNRGLFQAQFLHFINSHKLKKSKQIRCDSSWVNTVNRRYSYWCQPCTLQFNSQVKNRTVSVVNNLRETFQLSSQYFCHSFSCSLKSACWHGSSQNTTSPLRSQWLISCEYENSVNIVPLCNGKSTLHAFLT